MQNEGLVEGIKTGLMMETYTQSTGQFLGVPQYIIFYLQLIKRYVY